jgi:23S rRNA (guanosine2251-2'-O)-methyltransferase
MKRARKPHARSGPPHPPGGGDGGELLYGHHSVLEALDNPRRVIRRVMATRNALARIEASLARRGISVEPVHPGELDRLTGPDAVHQGVALIAEPLIQPGLDEIGPGTVVVLDQVTDPHNVGAIARSCAAFGVAALITTTRHSPALTGVLAKAASGALEHVPYITVTNLARALDELKEKGFVLLGLDSEAGEAIEAHASDHPVALVLGAEGKGLRHLTRQHCTHLVRLYVPGPIKSLNVSNAAALALYALRDKRKKP